MFFHGLQGFRFVEVGVLSAQEIGLVEGHSFRNVGEGVVGGGLVGEGFWCDVALDEAGEEIHGVDGDADGDVLSFFGVVERGVDGLIEVIDDFVEVVVVGAPGEFVAVDIRDEAGAAVEGDGEGLARRPCRRSRR